MKLTQATYEINGHEVEIRRANLKGEVRIIIDGNYFGCNVIRDEDDAWATANRVLCEIAGCRKKTMKVANVTNSEICDLGRVIVQIADFD